MTRADWTRAVAIYLPLMAAILAGVLHRRQPRRFAACLLSVLWTAPSLLIVQRLNQSANWWSFPAAGIAFRSLPLELYAGWIILWGLVPQLAFPRLPIGWSAATMIVIDLAAMPLYASPQLGAVLHLSPRWLAGEAAAASLVLLPALCLARWTQSDTHLRLRSALQVALAGMLFLFLVPEIAFALRPGKGWSPLLQMPSWQRQLAVQTILLLSVPGISAVMEFAERGLGTPIPYDPPKLLVTSGIYRYLANPMQLSCALVMLAWAALLQNGWLVLAAFISAIYSAGIAEWDERQDLAQRFGPEWQTYRASVHNWLPRWRPSHTGPPAKLYIASTCGPCSQLRRWLEARDPLGLEILPAETLPHGTIRRLRYAPAAGSPSVDGSPSTDGSPAADGIRALARALEHLHLGWALAGATLRLPLVWQIVQLLMDSSGLGPRLPQENRPCPSKEGHRSGFSHAE